MIVGGFVVGGGGVGVSAFEELAVAASVVVPVDVFEGGELDVALSSPGPARVDEFPFEQSIEALDHRIVVRVALAADRGDDVVVVEPLAVADRQVLAGLKRLKQHRPVEESVGVR